MGVKPFLHAVLLGTTWFIQPVKSSLFDGGGFLGLFNNREEMSDSGQDEAARNLLWEAPQAPPMPCDAEFLPTFNQSVQNETVMSFMAMGDIPYYERERYCLNQQLRDMDLNTPGGPEFMIHVGDIKWGKDECDEDSYSDVAEIFDHPSNKLNYNLEDCFFVVGDNEWTDCGKGLDKDADRKLAWARYMHYFGPNSKFGQSSKGYNVERQTDERHMNMPKYTREENFAFLERGTLFVGINLIGGINFYGDEEKRFPQNVKWITEQMTKHQANVKALVVFAHADMRTIRKDTFGRPFQRMMRDDYPDIPVLYM